MSSFNTDRRSRRVIAAMALGVAAMTLVGCGFQPLYGENGVGRPGDVNALNTVEISHIGDRPGQMMRNALIDRMHQGASEATRYRLDVSVNFAEQRLSLSKDASTERAQMVFRAPYRLMDKKSGKMLFQGVARTNIVYDYLEEQFGLVASRESALVRAINETSEEITIRVAAALGRAGKE